MARKVEPKNIGALVNLDELAQEIHKPQDHFGEVFVLNSFDVQKGNLGEFFILNCTHEESGEEMLLSTGAWQPKKVLNQLSARHLPVRIMFAKTGNSYAIVDPNDTVTE